MTRLSMMCSPKWNMSCSEETSDRARLWSVGPPDRSCALSMPMSPVFACCCPSCNGTPRSCRGLQSVSVSPVSLVSVTNLASPTTSSPLSLHQTEHLSLQASSGSPLLLARSQSIVSCLQAMLDLLLCVSLGFLRCLRTMVWWHVVK